MTATIEKDLQAKEHRIPRGMPTKDRSSECVDNKNIAAHTTHFLNPDDQKLIDSSFDQMDKLHPFASIADDGVTGEVRLQPSEKDVPKVRGEAGLSGIAPLPRMTRSERLMAMRSGELGSIHSWELVTAVDGPGTRLTCFLAGCPLRCLYCHNPDTLKMRDGTLVMAEDLLNRIARYKSVFDVTGGGVTFSGGEPMMQPAFLQRLLTGCRDLGIHTTIDTSGFLGANATPLMLRNLCLVLLDVKSGIPEVYKKVTGRPLAPTVAFGQRLSDAGVAMWIRFVLVPDLTDDPDNIAAAARIIKKWKTVQRIEVLPFHQMAKDKWHSLGMAYQLENTQPPSHEAVEKARDIFRSYGFDVY